MTVDTNHESQSTPAPCDVVAEDDPFSGEDEEFWWQATAPSLSSLLESCQYTRADRLAHLRWYRRFIPSALGPRPRPGVKPQFQPCPVYDGSACELSVNWKESGSPRTVRFTMEATGALAGTPADPFNQDETAALLARMVSAVPGLDLERFRHFTGEFFLSREEAARLIPEIPPGTPLSQAWVAFDLERGGGRLAKVYFMPILQWLRTGRSTASLVFDAVRRCDRRYGSYDAPIALLDAYLGSFPPGRGPVVEMVAIDCVDSADSRIKIYLRTAVISLARARETYTLGGRLAGDVVEAGVNALGELWPLLFRLRDGDVESAEVLPPGSYCGFAVEMRPGREAPEVKIHIPVRKIDGTDAQLCTSLSAWFERRGHGEFAGAYKQNLQAAFPSHDLEGANGTHTFVSFAYTKAGCYMTMYYSTRIMGGQLMQDHWQGYDDLWAAKQNPNGTKIPP